MNKLLLIGVAAFLGLAVLSFTTTKTFRVETVVPATPQAIWAVLMDTRSYPDWNPVFVQIDGEYVEGGRVTSHVVFPGGAVQSMDVSVDTVIAGRELRQSGGLPGVITFDHRWLLEPVEGGTKVIQHEVDRGLYLWFWDSSWILPAYQSVSDALKMRVDGIEDE